MGLQFLRLEPVAMNWVVVHGDIYAADMLYKAGQVYACPIYSTKGRRQRSCSAELSLQQFFPLIILLFKRKKIVI